MSGGQQRVGTKEGNYGDGKGPAKQGEAGVVESRKRRWRGRGVDLYWRAGADKKRKGGDETIVLAFHVPWRHFRFGWISWQYWQSPTLKPFTLLSHPRRNYTNLVYFPCPTWGHGDVSQSREYKFPERKYLIYLTVSQAGPAPHAPLARQGQRWLVTMPPLLPFVI